ncbi:hypothetical protein JCM19235_4197 [Vibrio maritimus]|uniref:Uncharacterized protein n=1 Tax=Vibrio maritimus TaxID=990268 RepID=A0A090SKU0_9VIBR|nr:hypothetical protein JCM19235_4197 [Vibrio maritimus]
MNYPRVRTSKTVRRMFSTASYRSVSNECYYQRLADLRKLIALLRLHREATHYSLLFGHNNQRQLASAQSQLVALLESKAMGRLVGFDDIKASVSLQLRSWSQQSVRDNQLVHSQLIRDALILVQDTISSWAKADGQTHLLATQRKSWQMIVPYMDTLTTLRLHIATLEAHESQTAIHSLCHQLTHQLSELYVSQDLSLQQHLHDGLLQLLSEVDNHQSLDELKERLYRITSQLSELIFHCYDRTVTTVAQSVYSTLPKIAVA